MHAKQKTAYHPYLIVAFYLHCLPPEWKDRIPRSTRYDWQQKRQSDLFGYEWCQQHQQLFTTLQLVASHRRLLRINRVLLRAIALRNFIKTHSRRVKDNIFNINNVVLDNLYKVGQILGNQLAVKSIGRSYSWFIQLRRRKCSGSFLHLCRLKHPAQLLVKEVDVIKRYCTDFRYLLWPLSSVYYQMRRDDMAGFAINTFYKYIGLLQLERRLPAKRRKHHTIGIRAVAPLQILHADTTVFRTADNRKQYIYLVQDNFSRAILGYRIADCCYSF